MQDMLDDANEIQDLLGRSFATPDEVDEGDLENGTNQSVMCVRLLTPFCTQSWRL